MCVWLRKIVNNTLNLVEGLVLNYNCLNTWVLGAGFVIKKCPTVMLWIHIRRFSLTKIEYRVSNWTHGPLFITWIIPEGQRTLNERVDESIKYIDAFYATIKTFKYFTLYLRKTKYPLEEIFHWNKPILTLQ